MFLNSLNYFRAIAILMIVAGHTFDYAGISFESIPARTLGNLLSGGTSLFVFISGFLFHHIFYRRYQFKKFMSGKLKKVLLPYTLLSIVPILITVISVDAVYSYQNPGGTGFLHTGLIGHYLIPAIRYYATGSIVAAYWYIPFVMLVFLMSPLHIGFIGLKLKHRLIITLLLTVISLFMHRPVHNGIILQSLIYFTPVYLIGIICSQQRENVYAFFKNKEIYLLIIAVVLAAIQAAQGDVSNYRKPPFVYGGIDTMLLQKTALCFFFMVWLHRFEAVNARLLNLIAATSFAIYFLHMWMLKGLSRVVVRLDVSAISPWFLYLVLVAVTVLLSVGIALTLKKILHKNSRYIIGY
ncbi:MAG: acyltransferase [Phormidesmis sp.]